MRIVTRGLGIRQMLVTRGYGRSFIERILREVIQLSTSFNRIIQSSTAFHRAFGLVTAVNDKVRLTSRIGSMAERIRLATNFSATLRIPTVVRFGRLFLDQIFKVASKIALVCGFDLRERDE